MKQFVRKIISLFCICLLVMSLNACAGDNNADVTDKDTTVAATGASETTSPATNAPETDAPATKAPDTDAPVTEPPVEQVTTLNIATSDELIAFADEITNGHTDFSGCTVNITADIDLSAANWTPMTIDELPGIIIDGNDHTISGIKIVGAEEQTQLGFISYCSSDITIRNIKFNGVSITATGKHAGGLIGELAAEANIENVVMDNLTIAGGIGDWGSLDFICFRIGGLIGMANEQATANISGCTVSNIDLRGFHNLAGLIGSDQTCYGTVQDNKVINAKLNYSAGYADSYEAADARQFSDVFYNDAEWSNHADYDAKEGNTFENVILHDIAYEIDYNGTEGKND